MRQHRCGKLRQIDFQLNITNLDFVPVQDFGPGRLLEWDKDTSYLTILETWVPNNNIGCSIVELILLWTVKECLSLYSRNTFVFLLNTDHLIF